MLRIAAIFGCTLAAHALRADTAHAAPAEQRYVAHAQVLLFSLPIVTLKQVGSGRAAIVSRDAQVVLSFAAGSTPSRAHGFNRLGLIEEAVALRGDHIDRATYFGFMTASKEESLEQARVAVAKGPGKAQTYTAIRGVTSPGSLDGTRLDVDLPASYTWQDILGVTGEVRRTMDDKGRKVPSEIPAGHSPATFLFTLHRALTGPHAKQTAPFLYNGKPYRLHFEKRPDADMGKKLATRRIATGEGSVWRLSGEVEQTITGKRTKFQVWYEPGRNGSLPLRIEYRARAFLRLIFEYDPEVSTRARQDP